MQVEWGVAFVTLDPGGVVKIIVHTLCPRYVLVFQMAR